jgi:hypothetical protein
MRDWILFGDGAILRDWYRRNKWWIDQVLHVVVFGAFSWAHPALGPVAVAAYELADWHVKLGPISIGQWPPGKPVPFPYTGQGDLLIVCRFDRVEDLRLDLFWELIGCALGAAIGRLV